MDEKKSNSSQEKRPFISIYWKCCNVFSRVYKNSTGDCYEGRCPRCRSLLRVPIGSGGVNQRSFIAE